MADRRINEAVKMGFEKVVLPKSNLTAAKNFSIEAIGIENLVSVIDEIV